MKQQANNPQPVTGHIDSVIYIQRRRQEARAKSKEQINSASHSLTWHQPCNNRTAEVPLESHWIWCALYLLACRVRVTAGGSGHFSCVCVTSFEHEINSLVWRLSSTKLTPLCVDSAQALRVSFCFILCYNYKSDHHRHICYQYTIQSIALFYHYVILGVSLQLQQNKTAINTSSSSS